MPVWTDPFLMHRSLNGSSFDNLRQDARKLG